MPDTEPSCSIFAILARDRRSAAVLRRGPSKQVQLIRWWLTSDTFEEGQWFKGRIYERRCDLSPNGERFVYFAQDFGRAPGSWTAVSKPPFLTALALWPKGDCWGGGALFEDETTLLLNHRPGGESEIDRNYRLPKRFKVRQLGDHSGWGEDDPINHYRLVRDGWRHLQEGHARRAAGSARLSYPFDPIEIYAKAHPGKQPIDLLQVTLGLGVTNGPWYKQVYALLPKRQREPDSRLQLDDVERQAQLFLADCCWADWAPNGDLLYAQGGKLFRLKAARKKPPQQVWHGEPVLLADWTASRFQALAPTQDASRW